MFPKKSTKKFNLDKPLTLLPLMYAYILIMVEKDTVSRMVVAITLYIMFVIYLIARGKIYSQDKDKEWTWLNLIPLCILMIVPVILFLYNLFYFLFGTITITILFYKVFEALGDKVESFLHHKGGMHLTSASYYKFCVWLAGFFVFLIIFLVFIYWFSFLYPSHPISLMIMKSHSSFLTGFAILILCIIFSFFIIDCLRKMVFIDLNPGSINTWNRYNIILLFLKIGFSIVFADVMYSLLYVTFSGIKIERFESFGDYILSLIVYLKTFYYAFCLHFAIPIPTKSFYTELDAAVKDTSSMYIIQFFHFCINKIIEITILAYMAGVILSALGLKKEK